MNRFVVLIACAFVLAGCADDTNIRDSAYWLAQMRRFPPPLTQCDPMPPGAVACVTDKNKFADTYKGDYHE